MDMMSIRRKILMTQDNDLPPKYKRLAYIVNPGYARILTNYSPVQYDEFNVEFSVDTTRSSQCLFSAGTDTYQLVFLLTAGSNYSYLRYFASSSPAYNFNLPTEEWLTLSLSGGGVLSVNDKTNTYSYGSAIDGTNALHICRRANGSNMFIGKLKSFRVTNDGTLKLNLIPCTRVSNGIVGMYDTVSKTFYSSASDVAFTAPS